MEEYQYIAHRGYHDKNLNILENTLEAFENAIKYKYAIELDVRLTKDEEVVVFHDKSLKRMMGREGRIKDFTLAELKKMTLTSSFSTIPTLKEVLLLVDGKVPLLIEVKNEWKVGALERKVNDLISHYQGDVLIESFNPFSVQFFKKNSNKKSGLLLCKKYDNLTGKVIGAVLHVLLYKKLLSVDFVAYRFSDLTVGIKDTLRVLQVPLLVWTIRSFQEAKEAISISNGMIFEDISVAQIDEIRNKSKINQ